MKNKKEKKVAKVSYHYKPDDMTLAEWQIALRRQAAEKESFVISSIDDRLSPGEYRVMNPDTKHEYKVVYRGEDSVWNYCSCFDFKTSKLGTCKHLEGVKLWIKDKKRRVFCHAPAYTSVYLSYKGEREVCLRIGTDNQEEFRTLAEPYFTSDGRMRPEALSTITDFFRKATLINNTFRWYPDALNFILEQREAIQRRHILQERYKDSELDTLLKTTLYPYQKEGIRFAFGAGKAIIADEMGLGKTIQAIGTAEMLKKERLISSVLIVCPTSLKYQWKKEIEHFTNSSAIVIEGNHLKRKKMYDSEEFYKIVSYHSICNDIKLLKTMHTDLLIMDEVQRLKNWNTQISKAARCIESDYSVILSGTPLENKLEELYSIMQFVDQYCLGPYYQFMAETAIVSETGHVIGYQKLNEVGKRMEHILIRRRKRDVALQLPERMDKILFVPMTEEQQSMHDEFHTIVAQLVMKWSRQRFLSEKDRKRLLLAMSQMRMVCDSTYILDQKTRFDTKINEVMHILHDLFDSGDEKVVIFSQWERMTRLVAKELDDLGVGYEYLHGGVPSEQRKKLMDNFTNLPESRVFLSTDAGSTGLNLQVASMIINLDLPWNPAVLEQRIARIYRIGQKNNIQVINLVSNNSFEEQMLTKLNFKMSLFEGILDDGADSIFLEDSKFEKMMNAVEEVINASGDQNVAEHVIVQGETEEKIVKTGEDLELQLPSENNEPADSLLTEEQLLPESETRNEGTHRESDELLKQGISFFSDLARTLSSPEATRHLVHSLIEEDKETGQTTLRIPVSNKENVTDALNLIGKLLNGFMKN